MKNADLRLIPEILPKKYHTDEVAQELISILRELETLLVIHRKKILQEEGADALHLYDIKWGAQRFERSTLSGLCRQSFRGM